VPKRTTHLPRIPEGLIIFYIMYTNSITDADYTYCLADSHSAAVAEEVLE
jgi:hypothetical protein